jgi:hypothetical protein
MFENDYINKFKSIEYFIISINKQNMNSLFEEFYHIE